MHRKPIYAAVRAFSDDDFVCDYLIRDRAVCSHNHPSLKLMLRCYRNLVVSDVVRDDERVDFFVNEGSDWREVSIEELREADIVDPAERPPYPIGEHEKWMHLAVIAAVSWVSGALVFGEHEYSRGRAVLILATLGLGGVMGPFQRSSDQLWRKVSKGIAASAGILAIILFTYALIDMHHWLYGP